MGCNIPRRSCRPDIVGSITQQVERKKSPRHQTHPSTRHPVRKSRQPEHCGKQNIDGHKTEIESSRHQIQNPMGMQTPPLVRSEPACRRIDSEIDIIKSPRLANPYRATHPVTPKVLTFVDQPGQNERKTETNDRTESWARHA